MKKLLLFFLFSLLISCSGDDTYDSWGSYATNKETKKGKSPFIKKANI